MPKPKKRKSFVNVRVKFAGQLPVVAEQPASSTSEVSSCALMLAGEVRWRTSRSSRCRSRPPSRSTLRPARTRRPKAAS